MKLADALRRRVRPSRSVAAVVLVALGAAAITFASVDTSVQGGAAVVIVPPQLSTRTASEQNPLLQLDTSLGQLATVLETTMSSRSAIHALRQQDATASFTIATNPPSNSLAVQPSPQLIFAVSGSSATQVERTAAALMSVARDQLAALQTRAQVPGSARATLLQLVGPSRTRDVGAGRVRPAVTVGVAILVLGLLVVRAWTATVRRRSDPVAPPRPRTRRRRREIEARALDPDADPAPRSR